MEGYKILDLVGEGSFGRVFKAKKRDTKEVVALKIIRKCGRTQKELLSLRSECQIQKHLHHRNIIKMINSFETDSEIVVVTEFCKRDLHYILKKQTYLSEDAALPIVSDLVSALYYLHSNRVLHRDLKPQNVLITEDGVAKLCDFGFARTMSRGTHVLTSIKGTPLYMAPELIEESPYDHNADLWSLGCIVYEMVVGVPPFITNSILHLVRMIRYEAVNWPPYLSFNCRNLLEGLLHKDPSKRLSWPLLLHHPFLQDRVSSSIASEISLPLTRELTTSQALAKECQKQNLSKADINKKQILQILEQEKKLLKEGACQTEVEGAIDLITLEQKLSKLKTAVQDNTETTQAVETTASTPQQDDKADVDGQVSDNTDEDSARASTPLETEEWLAFLVQSMKEVIAGDVESMSEKSFITMVTNALTNHGATPKVSEYIACLLAMPYVTTGVTKSELAAIISVYREVKVISSLMFALKLLTNRVGCSTSHDSVIEASKLSEDHLKALDRILVFVTQLVHTDSVFLSQFCDVVVLLHLSSRLNMLLTLHRLQPQIAGYVVAILTHILRDMPENANIVDSSVHPDFSSSINWFEVLSHGNKTLQTRVCYLINLMSRHCIITLQCQWNRKLKDYIEVLAYDSLLSLRCAADNAVEVLQELPFYNHQGSDLSN